MKKFTKEHLMSLDEDNEDDFWNEAVPEDFYFELLFGSEVEFAEKNEANKLFLFVTPVNYFDETGYFWDQHMNIDHLFSPYEFDCITECCWEISEQNKQVIEQFFLDKGFKKNEAFSNAAKN